MTEQVSPAPAGIDLIKIIDKYNIPCFPRTRGDRPSIVIIGRRWVEFPPHPRG